MNKNYLSRRKYLFYFITLMAIFCVINSLSIITGCSILHDFTVIDSLYNGRFGLEVGWFDDEESLSCPGLNLRLIEICNDYRSAQNILCDEEIADINLGFLTDSVALVRLNYYRQSDSLDSEECFSYCLFYCLNTDNTLEHKQFVKSKSAAKYRNSRNIAEFDGIKISIIVKGDFDEPAPWIIAQENNRLGGIYFLFADSINTENVGDSRLDVQVFWNDYMSQRYRLDFTHFEESRVDISMWEDK